MSDLIKALIKAQAEFPPILKNAKNPHLKNKYADLGEIIDKTRPILCSNGLAVSQLMTIADGQSILQTVLLHESGERLESNILLDTSGPNKGMQAMGSSITYARRYGMSAILGIVADEDDDGNASSHHASAKASAAKPEPAQVEPLFKNAADRNKWTRTVVGMMGVHDNEADLTALYKEHAAKLKAMQKSPDELDRMSYDEVLKRFGERKAALASSNAAAGGKDADAWKRWIETTMHSITQCMEGPALKKYLDGKAEDLAQLQAQQPALYANLAVFINDQGGKLGVELDY